MRWIAQSHHAGFEVGARLLIKETLPIPGKERPAYAVGDQLRAERAGFWHADLHVVEAGDGRLVVEDAADGTRYELEPTASDDQPISADDAPFEDYTVVR